MPEEKQDPFTFLLDKKEGFKGRGFELGGSPLYGQALYAPGNTGLADSIEAVQKAGLVAVPTYLLVRGRAFADKESPAWQEYHDANAERLTLKDENGILGEKGKLYAVSIENGGLFVWNPQRVRDAVNAQNGQSMTNYALNLTQGEVDAFLDAYQKKDDKAIAQIAHGSNVKYIGDFNGFVEASDQSNFLSGMPMYVVVRDADETRKIPSGYRPTMDQANNPDLIIHSGGKESLRAMLERAKEFRWNQFGSHHDGYQTPNSGRVVDLNNQYIGLIGNGGLNGGGRLVGVAPEALTFFGSNATSPLEAKVAQAVAGRPASHEDGFIVFVKDVARK